VWNVFLAVTILRWFLDFWKNLWAPALRYEDRKMGLGCAEGEFDPHKAFRGCYGMNI
jgi:hypothetical protein